MTAPPDIRGLNASDRTWASGVVCAYFDGPLVVSRGVLHDTRTLPGLVAERGGGRLGLLQYRIEKDELEVVVLIALQVRRGIGAALLEATQEIGWLNNCSRLWLITTNDNQDAQRFYRTVGWQQVAVHKGALERSRVLKPEIPLIGMHGIPMQDEIEFELRLTHP